MKDKRSIWSYLFKPFRYLAGWQSLVAGLLVMILLTLLGFWTKTYFDGALDVHYGCIDDSAPVEVHLLYLFGSWIILSVVMYLSALLFSRKVRFVDMMGTLGTAKAPYLLMIIPGLFPAMHICMDFFGSSNRESLLQELQLPLIISLFTLPVIVWYIALLYNAFSVSGNIKGVKGGVVFAVALIVSETISVLLLHNLVAKII